MAWQLLQNVKIFYSSFENEEIIQNLNFVDQNLFSIMCNTSMQSKIIDFFTKKTVVVCINFILFALLTVY